MQRNRRIGIATAAFALAFTFASIVPAYGADAAPAPGIERQTPAPTGRIIIKFTEGSGLSVSYGVLVPPTADALRLETLLATQAPGTFERHFSHDPQEIDAERAAAEAQSGTVLPNLNRYARLTPAAPMARRELLALLEALLADPAVETAFLEPVAVPAALGFDAFSRTFDPATTRVARGNTPGAGRDIGLPTPDFTGQQDYLDPAPLGVGAAAVWPLPGGSGQTVKVLDIEGAWLWTHEDLTAPFFEAGGQIPDAGWRNHGTAVAGEIRGAENSFGVTGIAHDVQIGGVSIGGMGVADAINTAAANLDLGDIFLIELHAPGPNANGSGQYGYVCMEYWQDNFDAIQIATANGRICCEAAGNGEQNFDDPVYQGLFDRNVRDSGAIICGATNGGSLDPAWFTNYGSRVDLHGWGFNVVTCGYGDLQGGSETQWYTAGFSGTSSASPIVLGSVASLQGLCKAAFGIPLSARLARDILVATGTPQNGTAHIGPRPNLPAAWAMADDGIGAVAGTVRDAQTQAPVPNVLVTAVETGAFVRTNAGGDYTLPLLAGASTLRFESFFYVTTTAPVVIAPGQTTPLDVDLVPLPTIAVGGVAYAGDGLSPLGGVRVTPLDAPFAATVTGSTGEWTIPGFPVGHSYAFAFDHLPGHGADHAHVEIPGDATQAMIFDTQIPDALETFEGDNGGFTTSGDPIWEYGTPTTGTPPAGFSGTRLWGVGLHGAYGDNVRGYLTSPAYDFSGQTQLRLSFHYWCESEAGFDGANLQVWGAGTPIWHTLTPLTGYNSISLGGIGYESGWSGSTGDWVGAVFDLDDYISSQVVFRLQFGSDGGVTGAGFWIDEIAFDTGDLFSGVAEDGRQPAGFAGAIPNPLRGAAQIRLALPQAGTARVALYDASGRRMSRLFEGALPAGVTQLDWNGHDDAGRTAAGGVYFLRIEVGGRVLTRPIVIVR